MTKKTPPKQDKPNAVGRPRTGKSVADGYRQHSLLLPDKLWVDIQHALILPDGRSYGFGSLVEHLLDTWIRSGRKLPKD